MAKQISRKILGIDPGTNIMGYAIIENNNSNLKLHTVGVVQLDQYSDHYQKLRVIHEKVQHLIDHYQPGDLAIEAPFYGKNAQSMLKLGRAQGVAISCGVLNDLHVTEYSPRRIKQSITGHGNASKDQLALMLKQMLDLDRLPKYFDATDALGVAMCHELQYDNILGAKGKKYSGWEDFIKSNPGKIK